MNSLNEQRTNFDFDTVVNRRETDSSKWNRLEPDILPMFVADLDFRAPEPIIEALHARVSHGLFGYPQVSPDLVEVIRAHLARAFSWQADEQAILPLPGVIAGFNLALKALTNPGDGVLVQVPAYPPIYNCAPHHGLVRVDSPLTDGGSSFQIDWDSFEAAAARSHVFLSCNPHNPTGRVFSRSELERMAEICLRHGLTIVSDEIHCDIVFSGASHIPIASIDPEIERNTVTLMAPSKTFGLPGLKASFAVIPNEEIRQRLDEARAGLVPSVNLLGQAAMTAAYRDCGEWLTAMLDYLEGNLDLLDDFVANRLPGVNYHRPEGTYLAWLDCRGADLPDADAKAFFHDRARVGLSNGLDFGPQGRGFARMCFGCPRALLRDALESMSAALLSR